MMRSKMLLFSLMLITILMLVACNEDETESKDARESTTNDEKETVSIMLDWYPNAVHSYLYVAQEKGILRKKISLLHFNSQRTRQIH